MVLNLCCTCGRNRGCPESCCALCPPGDGWQVLARVVNAICPIQTSASNNKRQVAGSSILPGTSYMTLLCDIFFLSRGPAATCPRGSLQELLLTSDASESSLAGRHMGTWAVWGRDYRFWGAISFQVLLVHLRTCKNSFELDAASGTSLRDRVSLEGKLIVNSGYVLLRFSLLVFGNVKFLFLGLPKKIWI